MKDNQENTTKETSRIEKVKDEEAKLLAREQARTKVSLAREQEIEKGQKLKDVQRAEQRAKEEIKDLEKEKFRKEAYLAREKKIAEEQEARKQKNKN